MKQVKTRQSGEILSADTAANNDSKGKDRGAQSNKELSGYYREEFGRVAPFYDFGLRQAFKWVGGEVMFHCGIVEAADVRPGQQVLDIACGTGTLAELLASCAGPEGRVVGVDMSEHMLKLARRKVEAAGLLSAQINFIRANAEELPFDDASFDRATASLAIHEMNAQGRKNALAELYRVLKPDGLAVIADMRRPDTLMTRLGMKFIQLVETDTLTDMWRVSLYRELGQAGLAGRRRRIVGKGFFEIVTGQKR